MGARIIKRYEGLAPQLLEAISQQYPQGVQRNLQLYKQNGASFYGFFWQHGADTYLIKMSTKNGQSAQHTSFETENDEIDEDVDPTNALSMYADDEDDV